MLVELKTNQPQQDPGEDAGPVAAFRVAIVCMPFASGQRPSIQTALVTAIAQTAGFETDAYHFNLDLAAQLSTKVYESLCEHRGRMTGEWLFAPSAFDGADLGERAYFEEFANEVAWIEKVGKSQQFLVDLRGHVLPEFINHCLEATDWSRYRVVGFTSTFQQNVACLALARRLKERYPDVLIVFGGANMEGEMGPEYARAFPFIDYVVCGEGDVVLPTLLRGIALDRVPVQAQGVVARTPDGIRDGGQAPPVHNLDALPVPDFSTYFDRATKLGLFDHYKNDWAVPFESARGCWWGQKHHCTFCGLNGSGMAFRAKSPRRVLAELTEQTRRHHINAFEAVDNILDLKYISSLFGDIEKTKTDYRFFYEVKANLTRAQIQSLYRGGVRCIQPGIESMSTHVLQLMRKGCSMLQNVRCLKWCFYYNIRVGWNLIWGFPGETEGDYRRELEVLECIGHLESPKCITRIWLERFSPYYTDRVTYPVRNVRPEASYRHVYPAHVNIDKIAYFFDYDMAETVPAEVHSTTRKYVEEWQQAWASDQRNTLEYRRTSDGILVDYKRPDKSGTYTLYGPLALIYEFCGETMRSAEQVAEYLRNSPDGYRFPVAEVRDALDEFCRGRLMLGEDGKYLSLAIPQNPNW